MRRNKLALYVHFVWSTWDREPIIDSAFERRLHRFIEKVARDMRCTVLAINGVEDHIHVLLSPPSTVTIAELAKRMKGASSHFVNEEIQPGYHFKWQGSYGAFTVSRWDVQKIIDYINHQKEHHANDTLWPDFEVMFEEYQPSTEVDERP